MKAEPCARRRSRLRARASSAARRRAVQTLLGADDSAATDVDQRSATDFEAATGFSVKRASCAGTQAGAPCVE